MNTNENQSIKERLKSFIMFKNISVREFERQIGVAYGFLANMLNSTSPEKLMRISKQFPELNIEWLMTGEGEMLRPNQVQNINGDHNTTTMNGNIQQTTESNRTDRLIESNLELIRQHGELIRQQGELIEMLKKVQKQD